jgi:membrane protein
MVQAGSVWLAKGRAHLQNKAETTWSQLCIAAPNVGKSGRFVWEVLRKYHHDDCFTYAASISFFLTISIIPLATLFFRLMAVMLGSGAYSQALHRGILEMYPYLPEGFIKDTILHSRQIGGVGFSWILLLVGAHWGVNQVDRSLCHIFGLRVKPHHQTRKYNLLRRMGVVLLGLLFLVILLSAGFEWSLRRHAMFPPSLAITVLPAMLSQILVTLILQHLPRRHVRFRHAFLGAFVATGLWWLAKWGFGIYYAHAKEMTWGLLYGSLSSLMAALVFLYYSCCIFLLGAEITAAFYRHETTGSNPKREGKKG